MSSKSKDKIIPPLSLLTTCNSLKLSDKVLKQSKKSVEAELIKQKAVI